MSNKIPNHILRIDYGNGHSINKPYMVKSKAKNAKHKILANNSDISCHLYTLDEEEKGYSQLRLDLNEEELDF